jgi:ribonuclease P protein component
VEAALLLMPVAPEAVQDSPSSIVTSAQFTAVNRLLCKNDFDRVINAENIADKYIKIFFIRNGNGNARLGIVASKKILPRAVDRNRFKRVIREAFRQHNIKSKNLDMVVMVRHACTQETGVQTNNLETLFSRVEYRCVEL